MMLRFYPTLRTFISALFAVFLLILFAWKDNDILASYTIITLAITVSLSGLLVYSTGRSLARHMSIIPLAGMPVGVKSTTVFSKTPAVFRLSIQNGNLPPLTDLALSLEFEHEVHDNVRLILDTSCHREGIHNVPFVFAHRGVWRIATASWTVQDCFGFWKFHSKQLSQSSAEATTVYPQSRIFEQLDPLYASVKQGDDQLDATQLGTDLYDIKRYHPSDGLRKIVWKVFARTGELLSRHPEQTMTPDGKVILLVAGGPMADTGYAQCYQYMQQMHHSGVDVVAAGLQFRKEDIASDPEKFLECSLLTAHHPLNPDIIGGLITEGQGTLQTTTVGLFIDLSSTDKQSLEELIAAIRAVYSTLKQKQITPVILATHTDHDITPVQHSDRIDALLSFMKEHNKAQQRDSNHRQTLEQSFLQELQHTHLS
jgi:hypothetical protein